MFFLFGFIFVSVWVTICASRIPGNVSEGGVRLITL